MAKKYIKCIKCDTDTPLNYSKYCDDCRLQISLINLQKAGYKPKERSCRKCNDMFFAPGPSAVHCPSCAPEIHKTKCKVTHDNYRRRIGISVGIGSGNGAGSGPEHHSYKTGILNYSSRYLATVEPICERCKIDIDFSNSYKWCVHHKDRNRENNNLSNLELLCKRCHIIEHDVIKNLQNR